MASWTRRLSTTLTRWGALVQLAYFEANNGTTGSLRMTGISRARRLAARYALLGVGPMFLLVISDALGLHEGLLWWTIASIGAAWGFFMLTIMVGVTGVSIWRAARVRRAMDRGQPTRRPRQR